jgi:formylglycine-generating enzyme required for sulfatase activity
MHGNVFEWCEDGYETSASATQDAAKGNTTYRVLRGGAWLNNANFVRSSDRDFFTPGGAFLSIGFRVARAPL